MVILASQHILASPGSYVQSGQMYGGLIEAARWAAWRPSLFGPFSPDHDRSVLSTRWDPAAVASFAPIPSPAFDPVLGYPHFPRTSSKCADIRPKFAAVSNTPQA